MRGVCGERGITIRGPFGAELITIGQLLGRVDYHKGHCGAESITIRATLGQG